MFTFSILRTLILCVTFRVDQTVDHFVPVDTDSVIHKLKVELVFSYKWCTTSEHNFTQSAPFHVTTSLSVVDM